MREPGAVPLLYPAHFTASLDAWPLPRSMKPNAIIANAETERWLHPMGCYCVVRPFSSKEERRRVVATVFDTFRSRQRPRVRPSDGRRGGVDHPETEGPASATAPHAERFT